VVHLARTGRTCPPRLQTTSPLVPASLLAWLLCIAPGYLPVYSLQARDSMSCVLRFLFFENVPDTQLQLKWSLAEADFSCLVSGVSGYHGRNSSPPGHQIRSWSLLEKAMGIACTNCTLVRSPPLYAPCSVLCTISVSSVDQCGVWSGP
jgi:hypothetical protein